MKNIKIFRRIQRVTNYPKLSLAYEDLQDDYYGSIKRVASFLNEDIILTDDIGKNSITKQGDERNQRWKERYLLDFKNDK